MNDAVHRSVRHAARLIRAGRVQEALGALRATWRAARRRRSSPTGKVSADTHSTIPEAPPAGRFVTGGYGTAAGLWPYKLYVPEARSAVAPALVVMLHGCTQDPDDFADGTGMNALAEREGLLVLYPGQTQRANRSGCWNWFAERDQQRDAGEPAVIAGMTREVMAQCGVDPHRVYVAGMSAGAAMALTMAATYPDLYAAVGAHSGVPYRAARDLHSAFALMRRGPVGGPRRSGGLARFVPAIVFHGDRDETVHPSNADEVVAQLRAVGPIASSELQHGRTPGGHAWSREAWRDEAGRTCIEHWTVHGGRHAWSGGNARGSYTDPRGPDASAAMLRFFLEH